MAGVRTGGLGPNALRVWLQFGELHRSSRQVCSPLHCADHEARFLLERDLPPSWRVLRDQASPIEATNSSAIEGVTPVTTAPDNSRLAWGAEGDDSDWSDEEDDTAAAVASTEGTGTDLTDLELLLQQRDDAMKMPTAVTASKKKIDTTSKTSASTAQLVNAFPAMPIDVMDEPFEDYTSENDFSHENKLLEEYIRQEEEEKSEDVDKLRKVLDSTKKKRAGGGGGNTSVAGGSGESYEKTPAHQRHFMRFQKRINRCPLQCLRYDYGGEPLWPVPAPTSLVVPRCACGEERVFELQLTPTINYFLKVDAFAGTPTVAPSEGGKPAAGPPSGGMDWLSILVYSCPSSCKKSRSEFIIVLPAAAT
jgi:pre-rRNA-processing protein TSR4